MTETELAILAVAAFLGMLLNATLGWLNSGQSFDARKFVSSILRGIVTVALIVIGLPATMPAGQTIGLIQYFLAFLSGAGVDSVGHELSDISGVKDRLTPKEPPNT